MCVILLECFANHMLRITLGFGVVQTIGFLLRAGDVTGMADLWLTLVDVRNGAVLGVVVVVTISVFSKRMLSISRCVSTALLSTVGYGFVSVVVLVIVLKVVNKSEMVFWNPCESLVVLSLLRLSALSVALMDTLVSTMELTVVFSEDGVFIASELREDLFSDTLSMGPVLFSDGDTDIVVKSRSTESLVDIG